MSAPALRFPGQQLRDNLAVAAVSLPHLPQALAVGIACLTVVFIATGAFWAGMRVQEGGQLAKVAAMTVRGPTIDSLAQDAHQTIQRWEALITQAQKRPRMPLGGHGGQRTSTLPTIRPGMQPHAPGTSAPGAGMNERKRPEP